MSGRNHSYIYICLSYCDVLIRAGITYEIVLADLSIFTFVFIYCEMENIVYLFLFYLDLSNYRHRLMMKPNVLL